MDPEPHRRVAGAIDAAAALAQHALDMAPLHVVQRVAAAGEARHAAAPRANAERMVELQGAARRADQRPLDDVLQLADIARPVMIPQRLHDLGGHGFDALRELVLMALDEVPDQARDVVGPIAQRRQRDGKYAEPVIEVGAEPPVGDGGFEVDVGRGDDPHVDAARP